MFFKAPALPRGAVRGCSYLKWRVEGRFFLSPGWSPTPPNSMLNRLSSSRGSPWCFHFFERIRFQDFFYFFVEKTLLLMKNQHFIIIITFHQITHQLVLSIFTWDFIFSSKFSLWKHHSQKNFAPAAGSSRSLRSQSPIRYVSWPKICLRWRKSDPPLYEHPRTAPLGSAGALSTWLNTATNKFVRACVLFERYRFCSSKTRRKEKHTCAQTSK